MNRDQQFLLPENMTDWLPGDHLAWFVIDLVETLDLALFLARYRGDGRGAAAFHPKAMLALLVYAYCDGERSSRRIEDRCRTDVAYRLLVAGQIPDHTTIARFRAQHEAAIGELFVQVLRVCLQAGMGRLGRVALDGTKAAAPASSRANKTIEAIDRELEKIAAQILAEAAAADLEEDTLFGPQQADPGRLPGRLRRLIRRRDRLIRAKQPVQDKNAAAQADYQRRMAERAAKEAATGKRTPGRKPAPPVADPTAKVNVTDPDSRLMKTVHRFVQGFNGQAMAAEDQLVLAADVVNDANDLAQLHPMIASAQNNLRRAGWDQPIGRLLADAGYPTEENLAVENPGMPDLLIAVRKDQKTRAARGTPPNQGPPPEHLSPTEKMEWKLNTAEGRADYARRGCTIEPVFGQSKHNRGMDHFMRTGLSAADSEWKLIHATGNLRKLFRRVNSGTATAGWARLSRLIVPAPAT